MRPIVRGSYLSEEEQHLPHTTIGVVIPTTPSQPQQNQLEQRTSADPIWQHIINPLGSRGNRGAATGASSAATSDGRSFRIIPDGAPAQTTTVRGHSSNRAASTQRNLSSGGSAAGGANRELDDRILEIQDYIRATSTLINTINQEKVSQVVNFFFI